MVIDQKLKKNKRYGLQSTQQLNIEPCNFHYRRVIRRAELVICKDLF